MIDGKCAIHPLQPTRHAPQTRQSAPADRSAKHICKVLYLPTAAVADLRGNLQNLPYPA